jgi:two-component sensor histidine kinase
VQAVRNKGTRDSGHGREFGRQFRGLWNGVPVASITQHCEETMKIQASHHASLSETTDERTIRLLNDEIFGLRDQAELASDREVELAASLLAAEARLLDSGVMLDEVNHRAKNNIQIAMSLLGLQMRASASEEVRLELATAIRRLGNIAAAHLMLNNQSPDQQLTSFRAYLTLICTETHQSLGGERISLTVNVDELSLDSSRAINLALVASEALTNAMKYAFPEGREGTIKVECHAHERSAALTVMDDGIGFAANLRAGALGLRLMRTLAKAMGGEIEIDGTDGTRIEVRFKV